MPPLSKSRELAELLRYKITSGELAPASQLEPIHCLAERYKTTVATVSKALDRVEQFGLLERIPGKGVFVRAPRSAKIAIVLDQMLSGPQEATSFLPMFLSEIDHECKANGWSFETFFNVEDRSSAHDFTVKLNSNAFDAVFIGSMYVAKHFDAIFHDAPVFVAGMYTYKELPHSISFDTYRMVYDAVIELNRRGCDTIALFDHNRDMSWSSLPDVFYRGYYDALKRIGKLSGSSTLHYRLPLTQAGGSQGICELLAERRSGRLGVISVDSVITNGAIQEALSRNLLIPKDIMIASQSNRNSAEAQFVVPIIKYENDISKEVAGLFAELRSYRAGAPQPYGVNLNPPVKVVTGNSALLKE